MEQTFSPWYRWGTRREYPGITFPGIYIVAISETDISGLSFAFSDAVVYIGMTNAVYQAIQCFG